VRGREVGEVEAGLVWLGGKRSRQAVISLGCDRLGRPKYLYNRALGSPGYITPTGAPECLQD
jgi:hypothetical protein